MDAIILAAGFGSRIKDYIGVPGKQLLRIGGMELILYSISSLWLNGVNYFLIVVNPILMKHIERVVERHSLRLGYNYDLSLNPYRGSGNGYSLLIGLRDYTRLRSRDRVLVSVSDHIYHPDMPKTLINSFIEGYDIIVLGDNDPECIDVEEATRIKTDPSGRVLDVGKDLREYNYIDTGLFIFNDPLKTVEVLKDSKPNIDLRDVVKYKGLNSIVVPCRKNCYWIDIDTFTDLSRLEKCRVKPHRVIIDMLHSSKVIGSGY